jgi:hypothetical protein
MLREEQKRLQTEGMRFLRTVGGFRPANKIRNDDTRAQLKSKNSNEAAEEQRQKHNAHTARTEDNRITKPVTESALPIKISLSIYGNTHPISTREPDLCSSNTLQIYFR